MDLKTGNGGEVVGMAKNGESKEDKGVGESKLRGSRSFSSIDTFLRADQIDFKSWDLRLDKQVSHAWSKVGESHVKEDWEVDLAKLDIRHVISHGTYGTVYKGVYDGLQVAGNFNINLSLNPVNFVGWICNYSPSLELSCIYVSY